MPAGLYVEGQSGAIQIDSTYANLALRYQGNLTANQVIGTAFVLRQITVTVTATSPVIAWRSITQSVMLAGISRSGTQWTFRFYAPDGHTFAYYIFDVPQPMGSSFGLEVFNAAGQTVFSSAYKYMRVKAALSGNDYLLSMGDHNYGAGNYAVCQGVRAGWYERFTIQDPDNGSYDLEEWRYGLFIRSTSTGINLSELIVQALVEPAAGPTIPIFHEYKRFDLLILDISGY